MPGYINRLVILLFIFSCELASSQSVLRLRPGQLYEPGEKVFIPQYGFSSIIPAQWEGVLPEESEAMHLLSTEDESASIHIFVRENASLRSLVTQLRDGFNLMNGIQIRCRNEITEDGEMIMCEVRPGDVSMRNRGFVVAKCGARGLCLISYLSAPYGYFEKGKSAVLQFMTQVEILSPSEDSTHTNLEWREFLSGKTLLSMASYASGGRDSRIHFCGDGSLLTELKNERLFKVQEDIHKGRYPGTWSTDGIGQESVIQLKFRRKLSPLEFTMRIKDEKIYVDGIPVFLVQSTWCK